MAEIGKDLEQLIIDSRNKFRTLVDGLDDEILSIDEEFRIITVNKTMALKLGLHPRDLIAQKCHKIIYGFDQPCPAFNQPCPAIAAASHEKIDIVHHQIKKKTPDEPDIKYLEVRAMPVKPDQGASEIILIRRDVTAKVLQEIQDREYSSRLEKEVRERTLELTKQRNDLARANDELMRLQRLKEDLTNMVVHDLKSPLSEIQANLEMLKTQPLNDLQEEFLEAAKIGSGELLRMILNLLDISRIEEDKMHLNRTYIDAGDLIIDTKERYRPIADLNNVNLLVNIEPDLPPFIADRIIIGRVLNNLLSNALNYTPESGSVTLSVGIEGDDFRFEVTDTGQGVPEELQEKIFEKFSQGHDGTPKTSSGLGLTFCRMAVQAHNGKIWVESEFGKGSRFIFLIPFNNSAPFEGPDD